MPTYLYTFIVLEYPRLFIEMRNNSLKELHVGMKAEGVLKAIYTEGHYDSIGLRIETECDCVDVDSLFCSGGSDIKSARNEPFKTVLNSKVIKLYLLFRARSYTHSTKRPSVHTGLCIYYEK